MWSLSAKCLRPWVTVLTNHLPKFKVFNPGGPYLLINYFLHFAWRSVSTRNLTDLIDIVRILLFFQSIHECYLRHILINFNGMWYRLCRYHMPQHVTKWQFCWRSNSVPTPSVQLGNQVYTRGECWKIWLDIEARCHHESLELTLRSYYAEGRKCSLENHSVLLHMIWQWLNSCSLFTKIK